MHPAGHKKRIGVPIVKVDCYFLIIVVLKVVIEAHREQFLGFVRKFPDGLFEDAASYTEIEKSLRNDRRLALRFMALGQVLGYWKVLIPSMLGFKEPQASYVALHHGAVAISRFNEQPHRFTLPLLKSA